MNNALEEKVDLVKIIDEIKTQKISHMIPKMNVQRSGKYTYSLTQLCELSEQRRVMKLMNNKERLHIEAHSGQHHLWVTQLPLSFKKFALTSPEWTAATRKRLMMDVFPFQSHCRFCKGGWCDVKGEHAIMCSGGHSRTLRHDTVRDIVARAARDVGFKTDLEHGGGLGDQRRPGDVIIYNWRAGRHLLIDVAVINPLCSTNVSNLLSDGVGEAATAYQEIKVNTYPDLDFTKYGFLPFIIEATGGMGKAAHGFCKELKSRRESLSFNNEDDELRRQTSQDPLVVALSVELQRTNSRMVLERTPQSRNLIESEIAKCEHSVAIKKGKAIENLYLESIKPDRIIVTRKKIWPRGCKIQGSSAKVLTEVKGLALWRKQRGNRVRHSGSREQESQLRDLRPPPLPDPPDVSKEMQDLRPPPTPDPPDLSKEAPFKGVSSLSFVVGERTSAPEAYQSRSTSTVEALMKHHLTPNNDLNAAPWEPPGKTLKGIYKPT